MKNKRTRREIERLAAELEPRLAWLEDAWGCRTEYEVDLSTGEAWLRITFSGNTTALVIRCDTGGITVPGTDPGPKKADGIS